MHSLHIAAALLLCLAVASVHSQKKPARPDFTFTAGSVIIEGESADTCTFIADENDPLFVTDSGGVVTVRQFDAWKGRRSSLLLTKKHPGAPYRAVYRFTVAAKTSGTLWVYEQGRAWASPFRWRVDSCSWQEASTALFMHRQGRVSRDGPTFAWTRLGLTGEIAAGTHRFEIEATGPRANGVYLLSHDFFALIPDTLWWRAVPYKPAPEEPGVRSIPLWSRDSVPYSTVHDGFIPWLEPWPVKTAVPVGAVVIFPGGGYFGRAGIENEPVARAFNAMGYHAFVCNYRVSPQRWPAQLVDAAQAVRIVRSGAAQWKVRPDRIAVCGFSAGGHLSAMIGVHYDRVPKVPGNPLDTIECRPDALVLGYPVISRLGDFDAAPQLFGDKPSPENLRTMSADLWVTGKTAPAFLWHCYDDGVKMEHSLLFADSLRSHKVPYELHIYPRGGHGLGVAEKNPHVASWVKLAGEWLAGLDWK